MGLRQREYCELEIGEERPASFIEMFEGDIVISREEIESQYKALHGFYIPTDVVECLDKLFGEVNV